MFVQRFCENISLPEGFCSNKQFETTVP